VTRSRGLGCAALLLVVGCSDEGELAGELQVEPKPATLAFAGDAMLGRGFNTLFAENPDYVAWRGTQPALRGVDILAFNLETTITDAEDLWEGKNYQFKLSPDLASAALGAVLEDNGVPAAFASTANNHALDYLVPGLLDTLTALDGFGLPHAGTGPDAQTAQAPTIVEASGGARIAFFAASSVCSCGDLSLWSAGPNAPGAWMIESHDDAGWEAAAKAVRETAPTVDYVVFSLHWGGNYTETWPVSWMQARGHALVAAGVDVIYGHSAHHVLPIERVGNSLILYGTGDFLDDYSAVDGFRNDLSYIGRVSLSADRPPELTVIPMRLEHEDGHYGAALAESDPDFARVIDATVALH